MSFEGIEIYKKCTEASRSARNLRICNENQYIQRYAEDPSLPEDPSEYYKGKGWDGWEGFLGQHEIRNVTVFKNPRIFLPTDAKTCERMDGVASVKLHPDYEDVTSPSSNHLKKINIQILVNQFGELERAVCLYLYSRVKNDNRKNMASEATALLMYFRFMAASDYEDKYGVIQPLSWDVHPFETNLKPVHMFKNWLYDVVENGTPAISTARMYLLSVVRFYKFVLRHRLYNFSDANMPFEMKWVKVVSDKNKDADMLSHTYTREDRTGHWVATTDVLEGFHKNTKKTKRQKLRPLSKKHQKLFMDNINSLSERDQLMHTCSLELGLRATECATLTDKLIVNPNTNEPTTISIGPATGVETKYSKQRDVIISYDLMLRLYNYKMSDKRQECVKKGVANGAFKGHLFLTTKGTCMSGETLSKYFIRYATKLQSIDMTFAHKHHNLRSTFATEYLWGEIDKGRLPALVTQDLMQLMGHENAITTMEYVGFVSDEIARKAHTNTLSDINESAMTESD